MVNLKFGSKIQKKRPPYLYEMYNIHGYYQSIRSMVPGLARLVNAFTEGMNKRLRLPKFIIIIMDKDIVHLVKNAEQGSYEMLRKCLVWLVKQVSTLIQRKRIDLFDKKPGSLAKDSPKVVWVKMLRRPEDENFKEINALRGRFNKILEECLFESNYTEHYILTINAEPADFTPIGSLNGIGKIAYWKEIDLCMKRFDRGEINLKPRAPMPIQRASILGKTKNVKKAFSMARNPQQNRKGQQCF